MKFIFVVFLSVVVLSVTAYPQSRNKQLKFKPKSSRQELSPATPTPVPDKTVVSTNTSQILTVANNSTPSVVVSTEAPKAGAEGVSSVAPPASVTTTTGVSTVSPPKSSTSVPNNATKTDEDDEDDSSEEEEDADADQDVEEGDFEGPPGPPGPEGDIAFGSDEDEENDDEDEDDDRAADAVNVVQPHQLQPIHPIQPTKKNKKGSNQEAKVRETTGGIDAYVPGYVTDQGEVLVPIDTLERGLQYTIISDRFVNIPQQRSHNQRNPVYVYRQDPTPTAAKVKPTPEVSAESVEESSEEEAAPEVYPVKETETSVIFATKVPVVNETQKEEGSTSQSSESAEDEDDVSSAPEQTSDIKPAPLGVVPATRPTGENDEDEVVGGRRSNNIYRQNFYGHPGRHFGYQPQMDYMNNIYDTRRLDYPVLREPYGANNFYRSYGRVQPLRPQFNGPYADAEASDEEDSLEDFGRSDFYDY